jgi:hypothetical protein
MALRNAALVVLGLTTALFARGSMLSAASRVAPPFPTADAAAWIGAPQSFAALRGKVVLVDVWTFG